MKPYQSFSIFLVISLLVMPSVYAFQIPGTDIDIGADDVKVGLFGAAVGAAVIFLAPVTVSAAAVAGAAVVGGVVASYAYRTLIKEPGEQSAGIITDGKNVTKRELVNDTDVKNTLANLQEDVEAAASEDILALRQQLRSSMVSYDFDSEGSLADIRISIKGPDEIYGFSAFPFSVNIYAPCPEDPSENKVHIRKVSVYIKDVETGQRWWRQSWSGDEILRNNDHTWSFVIKAPDPHYGTARSMISGTANKETLEELLKAEVPKYEIHVEIDGYRENWIWKTIDGDEVIYHEGNYNINAELVSLSAWLHENSGIYEIDGMEGSLPVKFADVRKYSAYKMKANGAASNFVVRAWATPVHIYDSTADYKFCFIANPDYFDPLEPVISDDISIITFRKLHDGSSVITSRVTDSFGELEDINTVATSMQYRSDNNTVSFDTYFVMYGIVETDDEDLPIWLVAKPSITVLSNREVVLADERVEEIANILDKEEITEEDIERIKQTAALMKSGLEGKKQAAIDLKNKCANNNAAKKYAEKSIDYYTKAISALDKLQSTDDPGQIATQLKLSKNYEMIGDYYADAAEKALYGQMEQAEISARNAQKLEEATKQYEPSLWFNAGSAIGDAWQSFKEGFGIGAFPDWVLILVVVVIIIGIAIIVLKIL